MNLINNYLPNTLNSQLLFCQVSLSHLRSLCFRLMFRSYHKSSMREYLFIRSSGFLFIWSSGFVLLDQLGKSDHLSVIKYRREKTCLKKLKKNKSKNFFSEEGHRKQSYFRRQTHDQKRNLLCKYVMLLCKGNSTN